MLPKLQAVIRQQARALRRCQLKGAWYALFGTLLCIEVSLLAPVGLAVSGFIDSVLATRSEVFLGTPAVRFIAQLAAMLVSIAIGFLLLAVTAQLVSRLRDSRFKRAKGSQRETLH